MAKQLELVEMAYSTLVGDAELRAFTGALAIATQSHLVALQTDSATHTHRPVRHFCFDGSPCLELDSLDLPPDLENPWFAAGANKRLSHRQVATEEGLVPLNQLRRTEFYHHLLRPADVVHSVGIVLSRKNEDLHLLSLSRSARSGPYSQRDLSMLEDLRPHLVNVLKIQRSLATEIAPNLAGCTVILDIRGGILSVKGSITDWLRGPNTSHALRPLYAKDGALLNNAFLDVAKGFRLECQVPLRDARGKWHALARFNHIHPNSNLRWLLPSAPSILLTITPIKHHRSPCIDMLCSTYGFSLAEARVAAKLSELQSTRAVANALNRSSETIRSQVKAMTAKTGTHSIGALIRLIDLVSEDAATRSFTQLGDAPQL